MTTDLSVRERTLAVIREVLRVPPEKLTSESRFREDLSADSLDLVSLMMAFEEEFKRPISDEQAATLLTVGDAVAFIEKAAREQ